MNIEKFAALARAGALVMGVAAASLCATAASAQIKEAKDVHVIFVTHGQANDVYWSVVKNGVEAGQKAMGSQVEYHAPETFDMVQMARLIDAAVAAKPDALVVSIPDTTALKDSITNAKAAGIPVGVIDTGIDQVPEWGLDLWVGGGSEYNNGVRAGEIMGEAGVKSAVCVNQEVGNVSARRPLQRLQGRARQDRRHDRGGGRDDGPDRVRRPRRGLHHRAIRTPTACSRSARASPIRSCSG